MGEMGEIKTEDTCISDHPDTFGDACLAVAPNYMGDALANSKMPSKEGAGEREALKKLVEKMSLLKTA